MRRYNAGSVVGIVRDHYVSGVLSHFVVHVAFMCASVQMLPLALTAKASPFTPRLFPAGGQQLGEADPRAAQCLDAKRSFHLEG
jgi:hypothetical protein